MTQQVHLNEKNFTEEQNELIRFLANRRALAGVTERALKDAFTNNVFPLIKDAKAQIAAYHLQHDAPLTSHS